MKQKGQAASPPAPPDRIVAALLAGRLLFLFLQRLLLVGRGRQRLGLRLRFHGFLFALGCLRLGRRATFLPRLLGSAQRLLLFRALGFLGRSLFFRGHRRSLGLGGVLFSLQLRLVNRRSGRLVVRHGGDRAKRKSAGNQCDE